MANLNEEKFTFTVAEDEGGIPVKKLIRSRFHFSSRLMTRIKRDDLITLNGHRVPGWVPADPGDVIIVDLPEEKSDFPPENIPIDAVFEDDDILVINKQPGITVHPTSGHQSHTIANGLMKYMANRNETYKVRFVNRLDMDTSGLLMVAKNSHAQNELTKQMKANLTDKRYIAIVHGEIEEDEFTVDLPIGRPADGSIRRCVMPVEDGGQACLTEVKVLRRFTSGFTEVELHLITGRTHQIRVHMSYLGHPLVGDWLYGGDTSLFPRQALHAFALSFAHPVTGEKIDAEAQLPDDMKKLIESIESGTLEPVGERLHLARPDSTYIDEIESFKAEFLAEGTIMHGTGSLRRVSAEEWLEEIINDQKYVRPGSDSVPYTQFVFVREHDRKIVGMIDTRHELNDFLKVYGGHIGYCVRPSERGHGYARKMLERVLHYCRAIGLKKVLLTCSGDNPASRKTIIACGGVYENTVYYEEEDCHLERYWIET